MNNYMLYQGFKRINLTLQDIATPALANPFYAYRFYA